MTAQAHQPINPAEGVDFGDLSPQEIQQAIWHYRRRKRLRAPGRTALRKHVDRVYVEDAEIVSEATQKQAIRSGQIRTRLLEDEGVETFTTLASLRGTSESAARAWVSRLRKQNQLFTVEAQGLTLIPRFQLTETGERHKAVTEVIVKPLLEAGVRPWTVWAWSTRSTGLLSGRVPAELVQEKPEVVQTAVGVHIDDLSYPAGA